MSTGSPSQTRPGALPASTPDASRPVAGALRAVLATIFWSSSALIIDRLSGIYHLTPLQISVWRVLLVLPLLAGFIAIRRPGGFRLDTRDVPFYLIAGTVGITISYVAWAKSVQINGPTAATALSFSAPSFVALGDHFILGTVLLPIQIGAVIVNLCGCVLASGIRSPAALLHTPLGLLVGLSNGLSFASYTLLGRAIGRAGRRDPFTLLFYIFVCGAIGLLIWGLLGEGAHLLEPRLNAIGWVLMVSLAIWPTLGAYGLYNSSLRLLPATAAVLVTTLEPPIVAMGALIVLKRFVTPVQWVGIGLIVTGVMVMQSRIRSQARRRT